MIPSEDTNDLTREVSLESYGERNYTSHDDSDSDAYLLTPSSTRSQGRHWVLLSRLTSIPTWRSIKKRTLRTARHIRRGQVGLWLRRLLRLIYGFLGFCLALLVFAGIFVPSYTHLPPHYVALRDRVKQNWESGSANINKEKVFIAASIFDPGGELAQGAWAQNILQLVHILGPENVYLSIYENDSGTKALEALAALEREVPCNHTLISEEHLEIDGVPHVQLPDGTSQVKRIAYLAEVRNRALRPLETSKIRFDKLLYLNDVVFHPIDAAQLLFSTNVDETGQTQYRSACAVDFIMPFKFYDTFATRDLDGYSMGIPFFPWFSAGGGDGTLDDILSDKDAVRVRSCWGGMVAFDAKFFQNWSGEAAKVPTAANRSPANTTAPYRFRAAEDLWWDSSECCLIQADIQNPDTSNPEIYMNPYIRVAYDTFTLSWLGFLRRFEKLYVPIHFIADLLVNLPEFNPRRDEVPWQSVQEIIWVPDTKMAENGSWHKVLRTADHDGFCGQRSLQIMKQNMTSGERNYKVIDAPPLSMI